MGTFDETFSLDDLDVFQRGGARRSVTRIGISVAQKEFGVRFQSAPHSGANEYSAKGLITRGDRLGKAEQIGNDSKSLCPKPGSESTKSSDHFVEDQKCTVLIAQFA